MRKTVVKEYIDYQPLFCFDFRVNTSDVMESHEF